MEALIQIIDQAYDNREMLREENVQDAVRQVIESIREFIPNIDIEYVDTKIMNQLSYEVSCKRFKSKGFKFSGDLQKGIQETIFLLKSANKN